MVSGRLPLGSAAGLFSTSDRFVFAPFLDPILDPLPMAVQAFSVRSGIRFGRSLSKNKRIWIPQMGSKMGSKMGSETVPVRYLTQTPTNAENITIVMPNGSGRLCEYIVFR